MYMENLFILGYVGTCRIWTVLGLQIRKGCQDFVHVVGPHQVILSRLVSEIFNLNIPNFDELHALFRLQTFIKWKHILKILI